LRGRSPTSDPGSPKRRYEAVNGSALAAEARDWLSKLARTVHDGQKQVKERTGRRIAVLPTIPVEILRIAAARATMRQTGTLYSPLPNTISGGLRTMRCAATLVVVLALVGFSLTVGSSGELSASVGEAEVGLQKGPQKNPIAADDTSVKAGRSVYARYCRSCHGLQGKGDGVASPAGSKPANLVDAKWDHGGTDAQVFASIKNGIKRAPGSDPAFFMEPWGGKLTDQEIWHAINFIRDLEKRASQPKK
jgi:mono/diheme cytochrome c family protein